MPADWKIDGMAQSKHDDIHGIAVEQGVSLLSRIAHFPFQKFRNWPTCLLVLVRNSCFCLITIHGENPVGRRTLERRASERGRLAAAVCFASARSSSFLSLSSPSLPLSSPPSSFLSISSSSSSFSLRSFYRFLPLLSFLWPFRAKAVSRRT